ncbi:uncharacterized protein LOC131955435 isoform X2 [Physella acuta]|uniref:uncharacterized protein LOC131955435 isoform X2 n=1 Tax=Physella acuta TaxID=109671 RepID=UPI0027DC604E|nr:uncharacterized protein LOC131955435 isoform X2 [Physella acuta]
MSRIIQVLLRKIKIIRNRQLIKRPLILLTLLLVIIFSIRLLPVHMVSLPDIYSAYRVSSEFHHQVTAHRRFLFLTDPIISTWHQEPADLTYYLRKRDSLFNVARNPEG